jgi:hypothetical protein
VMLRLKDFQWFDNCRCDSNLHAIFHVEMIVLQISHYRHSRLDQQLYIFWWCQDWRISNDSIIADVMQIYMQFSI